jgi:hypothetical protein
MSSSTAAHFFLEKFNPQKNFVFLLKFPYFAKLISVLDCAVFRCDRLGLFP